MITATDLYIGTECTVGLRGEGPQAAPDSRLNLIEKCVFLVVEELYSLNLFQLISV